MAENNPTEYPNICERCELPSRENICMPLYSELKIIISEQL